MNSKIGNLTRRHPGFEPGLPALEEAKLIRSLAMRAGSKAVISRRRQKPIFEFISVYNPLRGCTGFDCEAEHKWHVEGIGWPLKKADKTIIANSKSKVQALYPEMGAELAAA